MYVLHNAEPFAVDPFNEAGIPEKERNQLLIRDFLDSLESLSQSVAENVNKRYFRMRDHFGGMESPEVT
jgi:hypothetical protein